MLAEVFRGEEVVCHDIQNEFVMVKDGSRRLEGLAKLIGSDDDFEEAYTIEGTAETVSD